MTIGKGLRIRDIQGRANVPGPQGSKERFGVHGLAAAGIDEQRTWLHLLEECAIDELRGGGAEWEEIDDDVRLR